MPKAPRLPMPPEFSGEEGNYLRAQFLVPENVDDPWGFHRPGCSDFSAGS